MRHPDDYDDTIRHTPGAFALMAAVFEHALQDAADPRYRLSALRWLLSEGAMWAVEYGGADPQLYRARIAAIKVRPATVRWLDDRHFIGSLCKRGHRYRDTHGSLRRMSGINHVCVECDRLKSNDWQRRKLAAEKTSKAQERRAIATMTYHGDLCIRGHDAGDGTSIRYTQNNCCVDCQRVLASERRARRKLEEAV